MTNVYPPMPWGTHWKLAMRQLQSKAWNSGISIVFILLVLFFAMGGEEIHGFKLGAYLLFGLSLGLQPITAVWDKAQLRALGMSVADIRRNFLIVMPIASTVVCGSMLLGYILAQTFNWHIPAFWLVLAVVFVVHVASIIGALARVEDNNEVIKSTKEDKAAAVEEGADPAGETTDGAFGLFAGVLNTETRWRQQEQKGANPSALDYLTAWRIDRYMARVFLIGLATVSIGTIGWFVTGVTTSGAMWLYPASMFLLMAAFYFGEALNMSLGNWLVFSGDRRQWYAKAMGRVALWLPSIALLMLLGIAEFLLLHAIFPSVGNLEVRADAKSLVITLLVAATVAATFGLVGLIGFWVSNRFTEWLKWVVIILSVMVVSAALAAAIVTVQEVIEADGSVLRFVLGIAAGVALVLVLTFGVLSRGIQRFDTTNESVRENLGLATEA